MTHSSHLLWVQPFWLEQASQWIDHTLDQQGIKRVGAIAQPRIRAWSTILQIPTQIGDLYFKAVISDLAYEAALTKALFRWFPDCVPQILAIDPQRGWLLMADGGIKLRDVLKTTDDIQHWEALLPSYAKLQQESAQYVDELLGMGVCDRRLAILPTQFQALLDDEDAIGLNHANGLALDEYQQLQNCFDRVVRMCERLATFGIPETLHHGDLHDGNVFILNDRYRFFDWGDSSISHPFFSLHNTYHSLRRDFNLNADSDWFKRLKSSYLNAWTDDEPTEQLELAFELAQHLATIPAALRWLPVLSSMDATTRDKYVGAVPALMRELLHSVVESGSC
jgi:tRNA A-37 threonylcarbamoyl transferase component Bud32